MNGDRETRRESGILGKLGSGGPLTTKLDSFSIEARERLDSIEEHLARIANQQERLALRDITTSRTAGGTVPSAAGIAVAMLAPRPGSIWTVETAAVTITSAVAARNVGLFLGDQPGDYSRPLGWAAAQQLVGGGAFAVVPGGGQTWGISFPFTTDQPIRAEGFALTAPEQLTLHLVTRELTPEGEVG